MLNQDNTNLPDDIEIIDYIGKGGRAQVYKARLDNEDVVVKVYNKDVANKYLEKYNVDIAQFEFDRNKALFEINEIREYVAKPFRVYPSSSQYVHSIIQEHVSGTILESLIKELGCLPKEILDAGRLIVKHAEKNGIHDLDISVGNLKINKSSGIWKPKLYDFNIMPQYLFPPNPIVGLGYKLGIRKKSFRDYRSLRNWDRRGRQKKWIGRN
jgi:serine/threonine protein kinase